MQAANVNVGLNLESGSFVSGAEQARRAMVSNLAAIQKESARTATALNAVPNSLKGFSSANDNLKRFGNTAQQVGYQVADFSVQVAAGGSAITAFIQQGTQIAGAFGPIGAVIGAAGAVLGIFAKSLYDSGTNAEDAQTALDKLTQSTDEYKEALLRVQPLEIARLQNIIDYKEAAEAAAAIRFAPEAAIGRQPGGNAAQNPFAPGAGMLPSGLNPFTGQPIEQEVQEQKAAINRFEGATAEYLDAQYRARQRIEKAQQEIADRNKIGIIGKAETKPGLEERDYYKADAQAAKESAAAAKVLSDQKTALIAKIDEEVEASKRLTEAVGKGAYAQELANIENDKQKKILEASRTLKGEELELQTKKIEGLAQEARLRASINTATPSGTSLTQRQAETSSLEQYQKEAPAILQARVDSEKKAADKLADIYAQPFKDLSTKLSNTLSSAIQDVFEGDFDFSTISESFSEIFADTLAAAITSALQPQLNAAADEFGKAMASAFSDAAASQTGASPYVTTSSAGAQRTQAGVGGVPGGVGAEGTAAGGGGMTWGGAALGGAAAGGAVGGLYGQYGPNTKPGNQAAMGGAIGGGIGAGVGFAVGGPVGAGVGWVVGTAAGTFIGSKIGGQNNLGNDRSAQAYRSSRGITYSDVSFSPENRQVTQGILDQVTALQEALKKAGGAIADFGLRIEAGTKTGITVNGKKYPDAQTALRASLEELIGGTTGLTASQQTVLTTTKAKDAQGIAADLDFADQFDALVFSGTELEAQLKALDTQMQAFGARAGELGLSVDAVAAAHQREAQSLVDAQTVQQNQIRAAIEALSPSGNALEIQLAALNDQVQELADAAIAAGLPLDELAAAHQRAAAALIEANSAQQNAIRGEIESLSPSGNQLATQLGLLNNRVQELARAATAAGLPLDQLVAAHQRAAAGLVAAAAQAASAVNLQIAQLNPMTDSVSLQLQQLQAQVDALKPGLDELGQSYDSLAVAHQAAADKIIADHHAAQAAAAASAAAQRQNAVQAAASAAARARQEAQQRQQEAQQRQQQLAQQRTSVYQQISSLYGDNTITGRLARLNDQIKELGKAASEAGVPISLVTKAHSAAAKELQRVYAQEQRGAYSQIAAAQGNNSVTAQLFNLDIQMRDLAKAASDLSIPMNLVQNAYKRAAELIWEEYAARQRNLYSQIAAARGDNSVTAQLYNLDLQMRDLAKSASELNVPMQLVQEAYKQSAAAIWEEYAARQRNLYSQIAAARGDNSVTSQLYNLDIQMRELAKAASELNVPMRLVQDAYAEAAKAIWEEYNARKESLRIEISEIGYMGRPVDLALSRLNLQIQKLGKELTELGLPFDDLTRAHRDAAQQILDDWRESLSQMQRQQQELMRGILEAQRSAAGAIDQFLNPFKEALSSRGIGQGVYSAASLTESGLKEFRETLAEARTGDTGALSSLVGAGQSAISQARQTYGSTAAFAEIFREIEAGLREQRDVLEAKRDQILTQIGTFTRETVDEVVKLRVQAIADLRADLQKLSRDLIVAVEGRS